MKKKEKKINIEINYMLGDIVEHSFNGAKYKVIGYNYIHTRGIQYICLQSEKEDYLYMYNCELKTNKEKFILGFVENERNEHPEDS